MAEVSFLFVGATPVGSGLFFLDLTWDIVAESNRWWTWDHVAGWCGPIGRDINPSTGKPYRRRARSEPPAGGYTPQ